MEAREYADMFAGGAGALALCDARNRKGDQQTADAQHALRTGAPPATRAAPAAASEHGDAVAETDGRGKDANPHVSGATA